MRLLVVTQKVDRQDDVLGFFHGWILALAEKVEKLTVICLYEGEHRLPGNVTVLSLGKEKRKSRLQYISNFIRYIVQTRNEYTHVFVHMNQEYVLLGGLLWRLLGKQIALWRNHAKGNVLTRIAVLLSHIVFYTSPQSFTARFSKAHIMPVGIDTEFFKPDNSVTRKPNSILFLGRISPVKKVDVFIKALRRLKKEGLDFSVSIAGGLTAKDAVYGKTIKDMVSQYDLDDQVRFLGAVTQQEARTLYREHVLYVNLTPPGSFDKTILEALSCDSVAVAANPALEGVLDHELLIADITTERVAEKIKEGLMRGHSNSARVLIEKKHSLQALVRKVSLEFAEA